MSFLSTIMKNRNYKLFMMAALAAVLLVGCKKDKEQLNVSTDQVVGLWQKSGTQEYWHYYSDGTGNTWDVADGLHEGDSGSFRYTWYITDGNLLCHEMKMHRNEYVTVAVRNYIREITSSTMRWDEGTGEYTLVKMSE